MRKLRTSLCCMLAVVVLNLTACVTWSRIETPRMSGPDGCYHVTVPPCWIHAAFIDDGICISKDGPLMNWIEVKHFRKDQGFPLTEVKLTHDQLITEVAEYFVAELKARHAGNTMNHLGTEPAEIDGRSGFKVNLEFINLKGLAFEVLAYGLADDVHFYYLLYKAPRLYYFDKDLAAFEQLVASFKIGPGDGPVTTAPCATSFSTALSKKQSVTLSGPPRG